MGGVIKAVVGIAQAVLPMVMPGIGSLISAGLGMVSKLTDGEKAQEQVAQAKKDTDKKAAATADAAGDVLKGVTDAFGGGGILKAVGGLFA